jgi:hypothetical protein
MPRMKVVPTIKPCEIGFEMEVKAVDSFYKWRKKYREIGDAYTEAVQLGLATLEGDPAGRLSFVRRSLKSEAWIETEIIERCRFRRF